MVWTDSQDYGADEILSHLFTLTPPVQRAACSLPFGGSVPTKRKRNYPINRIFTISFLDNVAKSGMKDGQFVATIEPSVS